MFKKPITLDKFIQQLQKIRSVHGGDIGIVFENSDGSPLLVTSSEPVELFYDEPRTFRERNIFYHLVRNKLDEQNCVVLNGEDPTK